MLGRGQRSARGIVGEASQLSLDPAHDDGDDVGLMLVCQRVVLDDAVVLREASAATGRRRVLSQEDRMAAHRGLPAVVVGIGSGEALADEARGMGFDLATPPIARVPRIGRAEMELRPER